MTVEYHQIPTSENPDAEAVVSYSGVDRLERMVRFFEVAAMLCEGEFYHRIFRAYFLATDRQFPNREPPEEVRRGRAKALRRMAECIDPDHEEEWAEDWSELIERLEER